jgi:hypothetical protein
MVAPEGSALPAKTNTIPIGADRAGEVAAYKLPSFAVIDAPIV